MRTALLLGSSLLFLPPLLGMLIVTLGSRERRVRGQLWAMSFWAGATCKLLGVRVTVEGELPPAPSLLAPNHVGYIDVLTIGTACPTTFLSRADVQSWPVVGFFASRAGTLFIDRGRRRDTQDVGASIADRLTLGGRVVVFLEGKAGSGAELLPFRSSMLAAATRTATPCVPVAVRYEVPGDASGELARSLVPWVDDTPLSTHLGRLARLPAVHAHVRFLPARIDDDRKRLAGALQTDIASALGGSGAVSAGS